MIYILFWTTKKHQKTLSRLLHSKLKKNQGLFKDLQRNLRLFNEKWNSRTSPKIQGLSKTVRTLYENKVVVPSDFVTTAPCVPDV